VRERKNIVVYNLAIAFIINSAILLFSNVSVRFELIKIVKALQLIKYRKNAKSIDFKTQNMN
jgi:hypothetical protein